VSDSSSILSLGVPSRRSKSLFNPGIIVIATSGVIFKPIIEEAACIARVMDKSTNSAASCSFSDFPSKTSMACHTCAASSNLPDAINADAIPR
jgi:hypothetical protein